MDTTIWMYEATEPTSYHDSKCKCLRHCGNCYEDLDGHSGVPARSSLARYCSDYCRNRMKRERALDRLMESR